MSGRRRKRGDAGSAAHGAGESVDRGDAGSATFDPDSPIDLEALLGRSPTDDERRSWTVLSPALRRRAAERVALLRHWWGDRDGLTAREAAAIAGVIPNRFYQMAAAWKREPGLSAVGAYAAAPIARSPRIHPLVNASLQANVVRVVAEGGDGAMEVMRRRLEELVAADLCGRADAGTDVPEADLSIPSPTLVRAVITRELNRIGEAKLLGESIAMDCCPTTMRAPSGEPWALFALIDRGTLRIIGTAVGSLDDSVGGYALAARRALLLMAGGGDRKQLWAHGTRRADMVVGRDTDACDELIARYAASAGAVEFKPVTRPRRFGSLLRRYVGERVGRVHLRPGWAASAPPPIAAGEETFERWDAAARADFEAKAWNDTKALDHEPEGEAVPPDALVTLLRAIGRGNDTSARDLV